MVKKAYTHMNNVPVLDMVTIFKLYVRFPVEQNVQ